MNHTPSTPHSPGNSHHRGAGTERRMLPLTVWLCSDTTTEENRNATREAHRSGLLSGLCPRHRPGVGSELARHLITTCTREGDLVAEAFTTGEATLATAARLGRWGVALVPHFPLAQHLRARLRTTLTTAQQARAHMRPCRPDQIARALTDHHGQAALVTANPPPDHAAGRPYRTAGEHQCPACRTRTGIATSEQFGLFLAGAWQVLRPGGVLAITTTARHHDGRFHDPGPRIIRQAQSAGFRYAQHVIALRIPIDGDTLTVQAGPADLAQLRDAHSRALPPPATVHADVCLFQKPTGGAA
ncbi:class I SAM-dependent methyltransferase [Actinomadura algeriensis]|uniref:Uncharacterized protein n=1 Tax=Actinomadura algeriensis TaxID=1679523 RepID=A0ABR9JRR1_9ACTN|nr:hypothetical protein [Actinomadura algeriensis]MBE1533259.1 hypothetical protein [Actinomadura algeriensis]